jgi:hypothetical protein
MLRVSHTVTLAEGNGRLWAERPKPATDGLVTVLQTPSVPLSAAVRPVEFSCAAYDGQGDMLGAVTDKGGVYVFHLKQNRYTCMDRTGHAAQCMAFCTTSVRKLFVGFAVR